MASLAWGQNSQTACTGKPDKIPHFQHVVIVVEENQSFDDAKDLPYFKELIKQGGVMATGYYADTHPSINNYFVLTAGRKATKWPFVGMLADGYKGAVGGDNVARVLAKHNMTWKAYAENLPQNPLAEGAEEPEQDYRLYARRHNPFTFFKSVRDDPAQRKNIVPFEQFAQDLKTGLPNYSFLVPNLIDDGHDRPDPKDAKRHQGADCGDPVALPVINQWLKCHLNPLMESFQKDGDGLLMIVFDEACNKGAKKDEHLSRNKNDDGGGHIVGILAGAHLPPGGCSLDKDFNHESILRLSLKALGVEEFPGKANDAVDLGEFFLSDEKPNAVDGTKH